MRVPRSVVVCVWALPVLAAVLAAQTVVASEQVQTVFTVDANTTALYLFKEGTGTTSAPETTSPLPPSAAFHGTTGLSGATATPWPPTPVT